MSDSGRPAAAAPPRNARPFANVLETIGWTPLIRLNRVVDGAISPVYAKTEFFNPGGSVKDRIGLAMIEDAERSGRLQPGGIIVEGTSGNTGVGLAIAAAIRGYRCIFTMPDKMSQEKVRLLRAFGAEVIVTPTAVPPDHPDNYVQTAKRIVAETPGAILADQFYNPVNPQAHYATTGPELWEQTEGRITHLIAAAGTGGTISGVGKFLKEKNPSVRVIAGDPPGSIFAEYHRTGKKGEGAPYKVEGIGNDKLPSTLDFSVIDEYRIVSDRDAFRMGRRMTREEGLFVGGSAGLIVWLGARVAQEVNDPDACIVCIVPDTGERYLSKMYSDEWMRENRLLEPERMTAGEMIVRKDGSAPALVSVERGTAVREALRLITDYNISQLPVCDGDECVGAVPESALMARIIEDQAALDQPVESIMEPAFPVIDGSLPLSGISRLLTRQCPAVLVRDDGVLTGIITRFDVVRYLTP
ncbi:MAG TPA: pyridoxal-phosphate dependent enzyme [Longimicrobiales bacterium]|nr:pyridoxal-phosphate dependent enzyme [Longimicrobiales bacterium]